MSKQQETSFLELALQDVPETQIAESGTEAELQITSCKLKKSETSGNIYFAQSFDVVTDDADYEPIYHSMLTLPTAAQTTKEQNRRKREIIKWAECFNINFGSIDSYLRNAVLQIEAGETVGKFEDAIGQTGRASLKIGQDQNGNERNEIARFIN